jgi:uncharacterized protein (DUF169 family)
MELKQVHEYAAELERKLRLRTYPLAIKMIEREEDIPRGAKRPLRDFGAHFDLCQLFATSRRSGSVIVATKEDNWCCEPVIGMGLAEPPQEFLEGHNRYPQDVESLQAGKNYASDFPRLPAGKYFGIMSAPLAKTPVAPDVIVMYVDSEQLSLLMLAREYKDGHDLKVNLSSHAACVYGVVPSIQNGECSVAVPCRGDHYFAMAGNDEIIFTIPLGKLEDIILGLRHVESSGSKLPRNFKMKPEPEHPASYMAIAHKIGMFPGE